MDKMFILVDYLKIYYLNNIVGPCENHVGLTNLNLHFIKSEIFRNSESRTISWQFAFYLKQFWWLVASQLHFFVERVSET